MNAEENKEKVHKAKADPLKNAHVHHHIQAGTRPPRPKGFMTYIIRDARHPSIHTSIHLPTSSG
jgi:hypothetical protein